MNRQKIFLLVFLFILVSTLESLSQCAMCRSAVESTMSNGRNNAGVGLNTGILYLFAAPYLVVAVVGYLWYRTSLKNSKARVALESQMNRILTSSNK